MSPVKVKCDHCLGNKNSDLSLCDRHFKALQNKWYRTAEKSGFVDIETNPGTEASALAQWHSQYFLSEGRYTPEAFKMKEEYYQLAGQFLNNYPFIDKGEKMVWELHARGYAIRSIVQVLKSLRVRKVCGYSVTRKNVHQAIQRLVRLMLTNGDSDEQK